MKPMIIIIVQLGYRPITTVCFFAIVWSQHNMWVRYVHYIHTTYQRKIYIVT